MNEIPELTKKELKQFGCILGILIAVVFGVVIPWLWSALTFPNVYIIGIGVGVTIFSLVFPSQVIYLYKPYMRLALFIGKIINSIILGIIYYLLIFPMSLVLRLLKIDLLHAKYENSKNTYRIQSTDDDSSHFEKPF